MSATATALASLGILQQHDDFEACAKHRQSLHEYLGALKTILSELRHDDNNRKVWVSLCTQHALKTTFIPTFVSLFDILRNMESDSESGDQKRMESLQQVQAYLLRLFNAFTQPVSSDLSLHTRDPNTRDENLLQLSFVLPAKFTKPFNSPSEVQTTIQILNIFPRCPALAPPIKKNSSLIIDAPTPSLITECFALLFRDSHPELLWIADMSSRMRRRLTGGPSSVGQLGTDPLSQYRTKAMEQVNRGNVNSRFAAQDQSIKNRYALLAIKKSQKKINDRVAEIMAKPGEKVKTNNVCVNATLPTVSYASPPENHERNLFPLLKQGPVSTFSFSHPNSHPVAPSQHRRHLTAGVNEAPLPGQSQVYKLPLHIQSIIFKAAVDLRKAIPNLAGATINRIVSISGQSGQIEELYWMRTIAMGMAGERIRFDGALRAWWARWKIEDANKNKGPRPLKVPLGSLFIQPLASAVVPLAQMPLALRNALQMANASRTFNNVLPETLDPNAPKPKQPPLDPFPPTYNGELFMKILTPSVFRWLLMRMNEWLGVNDKYVELRTAVRFMTEYLYSMYIVLLTYDPYARDKRATSEEDHQMEMQKRMNMLNRIRYLTDQILILNELLDMSVLLLKKFKLHTWGVDILGEITVMVAVLLSLWRINELFVMSGERIPEEWVEDSEIDEWRIRMGDDYDEDSNAEEDEGEDEKEKEKSKKSNDSSDSNADILDLLGQNEIVIGKRKRRGQLDLDELEKDAEEIDDGFNDDDLKELREAKLNLGANEEDFESLFVGQSLGESQPLSQPEESSSPSMQKDPAQSEDHLAQASAPASSEDMFAKMLRSENKPSQRRAFIQQTDDSSSSEGEGRPAVVHQVEPIKNPSPTETDEQTHIATDETNPEVRLVGGEGDSDSDPLLGDDQTVIDDPMDGDYFGPGSRPPRKEKKKKKTESDDDYLPPELQPKKSGGSDEPSWFSGEAKSSRKKRRGRRMRHTNYVSFSQALRRVGANAFVKLYVYVLANWKTNLHSVNDAAASLLCLCGDPQEEVLSTFSSDLAMSIYGARYRPEGERKGSIVDEKYLKLYGLEVVDIFSDLGKAANLTERSPPFYGILYQYVYLYTFAAILSEYTSSSEADSTPSAVKLSRLVWSSFGRDAQKDHSILVEALFRIRPNDSRAFLVNDHRGEVQFERKELNRLARYADYSDESGGGRRGRRRQKRAVDYEMDSDEAVEAFLKNERSRFADWSKNPDQAGDSSNEDDLKPAEEGVREYFTRRDRKVRQLGSGILTWKEKEKENSSDSSSLDIAELFKSTNANWTEEMNNRLKVVMGQVLDIVETFTREKKKQKLLDEESEDEPDQATSAITKEPAERVVDVEQNVQDGSVQQNEMIDVTAEAAAEEPAKEVAPPVSAQVNKHVLLFPTNEIPSRVRILRELASQTNDLFDNKFLRQKVDEQYGKDFFDQITTYRKIYGRKLTRTPRSHGPGMRTPSTRRIERRIGSGSDASSDNDASDFDIRTPRRPKPKRKPATPAKSKKPSKFQRWPRDALERIRNEYEFLETMYDVGSQQTGMGVFTSLPIYEQIFMSVQDDMKVGGKDIRPIDIRTQLVLMGLPLLGETESYLKISLPDHQDDIKELQQNIDKGLIKVGIEETTAAADAIDQRDGQDSLEAEKKVKANRRKRKQALDSAQKTQTNKLKTKIEQQVENGIERERTAQSQDLSPAVSPRSPDMRSILGSQDGDEELFIF
ncbi:hypothetical protein BLNAU_89 [Blattamonas nauphoetae]|uniref:Timeless N-terminal domain-containing protein n=1 Tax=Blattamonas nauphoetae TaxID=2049346 RepID=A0ABQ9YMM7_9EUKA|nr:hypothetical protein BLNAU_89 [Blattamonas nauphoetae]